MSKLLFMPFSADDFEGLLSDDSSEDPADRGGEDATLGR
jgi:hypothetical protein